MRGRFLVTFFLVCSFFSRAQDTDSGRVAKAVSDNAIMDPLIFLASDKMRGRHIGTPEIDSAANYIARQFKRAGCKPIPGANGYFQEFSYSFDPLSRFFQTDPQAGVGIPWHRPVNLKNVAALVLGTDPILRRQFIILSSHYDHIGVADHARFENGKRDSIFNGARDNATGTAAVIAAAHFFAHHPPKRSILFICYTAEEEGLIGSLHYANNPLVPLNWSVFNLNIDNASYNTTNSICLFGRDRTSKDSLIYKACEAFGMGVMDDPTGDRLFKSSDNLSLAQVGIPAPTFSLGIVDWNDHITDRYHRLSDETGNMDKEYVIRFVRAYILAAKYIADDPLQPRWTAGDPFEAAWMKLFHKE